MMGSSAMPNASSLSELAAMCELIKAVTDKAESAAMIKKMLDARKAYDAAIAESESKQRDAKKAADEAADTIARAEAATEKLTKKTAADHASIVEQRADLMRLKDSIKEDAEALKALEISVRNEREAVARRVADQEASFAREKKSISDQAAEVSKQREGLAQALINADIVKSEYAAKLDKIKALAL